jgi:UMF1 family MFS transporter
MFTFAYIEDLTEDIHNSVLALGVFFLIGLAWTYSALKKQKQLV